MPKKPASKRRAGVLLVVETAHVEGITYQLRYTRCGKARCKKGCRDGRATHGPYWYAMHWSKGTTRAHYVGKELPRIDELADRPEGRKPT
jgi:hypothetical protein